MDKFNLDSLPCNEHTTRLDEHTEMLRAIGLKADEILRTIKGDPALGVPGLVPMATENRKRIESLEHWRVYVIGGGAVLFIIYQILVDFNFFRH